MTEVISFLKRDLRLKEIYHEIICQKIIDRTAQEYGVIVYTEEIQAELDRIRLEKGFCQPSDVFAWLSDQMATLSDLEQRIREHLLAKKLARCLFSEKIQDFFTQNKADFEQILLYRITVPYESLAQELFYQIEEEEISFYEAAHLYDVNARRRLQCGYEGKYYRRSLQPELAEILFNGKVGQLLGPFKSSEEAYDLFLVEEVLPSELPTEAYDALLNQMFQEWLDNELNAYIREHQSQSVEVG